MKPVIDALYAAGIAFICYPNLEKIVVLYNDATLQEVSDALSNTRGFAIMEDVRGFSIRPR